MAQALVDEFRPPYGGEHPIKEIALIPGTKGMYEVSIDGTLVYSKLATGKHIADRDAIALIRQATR